jgi:hypothetical protein
VVVAGTVGVDQEFVNSLVEMHKLSNTCTSKPKREDPLAHIINAGSSFAYAVVLYIWICFTN